jgi:hypothetical protein
MTWNDRKKPGQPSERRSMPRSEVHDRTDYEQRHFVNLVATACILAIGLALGWTVKAFDRQLALEKCLDSGRKDCVRVAGEPVRSVIQLTK